MSAGTFSLSAQANWFNKDAVGDREDTVAPHPGCTVLSASWVGLVSPLARAKAQGSS